MSNADIVRACFDSYVRQDRARAEGLIGDAFVFTSPQDDHIDRATYFERCFRRWTGCGATSCCT